jgi:hypothetical protein
MNHAAVHEDFREQLDGAVEARQVEQEHREGCS